MALLKSRAHPLRLRCAFALLASAACAALATPSEYQLKAVFLFNFAQFVEWPADASPGPGKPFVIGVLGDDPFGQQLDDVVRGESVNTHPLVVERYHSVHEIRDCNILFIPRSEHARLDEILAALKGRSILTVSDAEGPLLRGVMIGLVTQNSRIRLRIDVAATRAVNLTVSSKLLRPAEVVGAAEG